LWGEQRNYIGGEFGYKAAIGGIGLCIPGLADFGVG
jgi:hypothetical protein